MIVYFHRNPEQLPPLQLETLVDSMPMQQQEIVARTKSHRQKCEQAIAYTMLCHALNHNTAEINDPAHHIETFPESAIRIQNPLLPLWAFGAHGKPSIINYEGIHFNISHCKEAVAIGISDHEVGIDVEGRRRFSDTLLQRAFNNDEQELVATSNDAELEFARIWTRKEAYFKWTGTGILMDHLKSVDTDASADGCVLTSHLLQDFYLTVAERRDDH